MEADIPKITLRWFDIWRMAFLHPSIKTFSQITSDPKASIRWGVIWMAIATCLVWLFGPLRLLLWGWVATNFGILSSWPVSATGAVVVPLCSVVTLLLSASVAHGLARLFHAEGTFRKLVYCWGVLQLPFVVLALLVLNFPIGFPSWPGTGVSRLAMSFTIAKLVICVIVILYLAYAQVVAFGAVEGFGIWKAFGISVLLSTVLGIIGACLSTGLGELVASAYQY